MLQSWEASVPMIESSVFVSPRGVPKAITFGIHGGAVHVHHYPILVFANKSRSVLAFVSPVYETAFNITVLRVACFIWLIRYGLDR